MQVSDRRDVRPGGSKTHFLYACSQRVNDNVVAKHLLVWLLAHRRLRPLLRVLNFFAQRGNGAMGTRQVALCAELWCRTRQVAAVRIVKNGPTGDKLLILRTSRLVIL
jgi:hypothetical protein